VSIDSAFIAPPFKRVHVDDILLQVDTTFPSASPPFKAAHSLTHQAWHAGHQADFRVEQALNYTAAMVQLSERRGLPDA
jgi:hypothetical protein